MILKTLAPEVTESDVSGTAPPAETPKPAGAKEGLQREVSCKQFSQLLRGLSRTKDSINHANAHVMRHAAIAGAGKRMVQIIVEVIGRVRTPGFQHCVCMCCSSGD